MCGVWFQPDLRVGKGQRTCGKASCRKEQRRRTQASYYARNPDYWVSRRLRKQADRAEQQFKRRGGRQAVLPPPAAVGRVPWEIGQEALKARGLILMGYVVRLLLRLGQDAMRAQVQEQSREFRRLLRMGSSRRDAEATPRMSGRISRTARDGASRRD